MEKTVIKRIKTVLLTVFGLLLVLPSLTNAQLNNPFGGHVVFVKPCLASFNVVITVVPAKPDLPKNLIFQLPLSKLFAFYQIRPGVNVLGTWFGLAHCLHLVPFPPFVIPDPITPLAPMITMIGTSGGQLSDRPPADDGDSGDGGEPPTKPACSDGVDNDSDGLIDFPNDPGCLSATDRSETEETCDCACDAQDEEATRATLSAAGIGVNRAACRRDRSNVCLDAQRSGCTNVRCLPQGAIDKLVGLKNRSGCSIVITGGTESGSHATHGQCRPIVDLRLNSCLNAYIQNNSTNVRDVGYGVEYRLPDGRYVLESDHWHVIY